jgi:hypothetical protein
MDSILVLNHGGTRINTEKEKEKICFSYPPLAERISIILTVIFSRLSG